MGFEIVKRSIIGISYGGIFTFIALTILKVQNIEVSVSDIWLNMLGSLVIGIYFGVASLIFDIETWSPLKQTVFHLILSLIVFFPLAISIGWIPLKTSALIIALGIFIIIYALFWSLFWFGTKWYVKKLERFVNDSVKK